MLQRTLGPPRLSLSLRAFARTKQGQLVCIHSSSLAATDSSAESPAYSPLARGWREKRVLELKAELKRRGLPTTGKKDEVLILLR